ncbi:MAG: cytochrome c3 family protein [Desulfuromonadaceae bacterium]|nr:cytochrome c3 family protein [Desulfuromonadaceae bacterium]
MKRLSTTGLTICVIMYRLFIAGTLHATTFTVLSPPNNTFVESKQISVVVSLPNGEATTASVITGGKTYTKSVPTRAGGHTICIGVPLANGLNFLDITTSNRFGISEKESLSLYLRSALSKSHQNPPAEFKRYYFHTPANETACAPCHKLEPSLYDLNPEKLEDSPCYQCHKDKASGVYKHKPVSAGKCFSCHEVSRDKRKYATTKPDQTTCFLCHSTQGRLWKKKRIHHGPTAVGNCTLCHDPHGSDWPSFTRLHPTDLCLNCHNDKKTGLHVIAGFFGKGHPVKAAKSPLKPDRPFSCAGCHNPHAGDTQSLLNKERDKLEDYCQTCHKL